MYLPVTTQGVVLCSGLPENEHCLSDCLSARDENVAVLIYTQVRACLQAYNTLYSAAELFRECNCREQHPGELSGKLPPICRENCRVARLRKARPLYRPRVPNDRLAHPELLRIQQNAWPDTTVIEASRNRNGAVKNTAAKRGEATRRFLR